MMDADARAMAQELTDSIQHHIADIGPAFALRHDKRHGKNSRDLVYAAIAEVRRIQDILTTDYSDIK